MALTSTTIQLVSSHTPFHHPSADEPQELCVATRGRFHSLPVSNGRDVCSRLFPSFFLQHWHAFSVCLPSVLCKKSTTAICAITLVVLQVCFALYTHTPTATCKQNIPQSPPAAKPAQRNYLLTEMMQLRDSPRDKWMHDRQGIQQRQLQ